MELCTVMPPVCLCVNMSGCLCVFLTYHSFRVLIAFGEAVCRPAGGSLIAEYFDVQHRAKVHFLSSKTASSDRGRFFFSSENIKSKYVETFLSIIRTKLLIEKLRFSASKNECETG